jgi:hypothetical protein
MSDLTTADGFEIERATKNGKEYDGITVSRWSKKGDRLYLNGHSKFEKHGVYVDLTTAAVVDMPSSRTWSSAVSVEGDTLTVEITYGKVREKTYVIKVNIEGDAFESAPEPRSVDDDNAEPAVTVAPKPVATDGGVESAVTTTEIEDAIRQHDDPDHEDAATAAEVKRALGRINEDILAFWSEHQDAIDGGHMEVVAETRDMIVLADHTGHFWSEQFRADGLNDEPLQRIITTLHHEMARRYSDRSWSASSPVVVQKPPEFRAGERGVLREIARRTEETGSVARAVDQLATEVHGWAKGDWARQTGRNPSTVTRTTRPKEDDR